MARVILLKVTAAQTTDIVRSNVFLYDIPRSRNTVAYVWRLLNCLLQNYDEMSYLWEIVWLYNY